MKTKKKIYGLASILWAALILFLSWNPGLQAPFDLKVIPIDKVGHLFFYLIFSFLTLGAINKKNLVFSLCCAFGLLMECLQYFFFPGRHFELLDVLSNVIGVYLGILLYTKLKI